MVDFARKLAIALAKVSAPQGGVIHHKTSRTLYKTSRTLLGARRTKTTVTTALLLSLVGCATQQSHTSVKFEPAPLNPAPHAAHSLSSKSVYDLLAAELLGLQGDVDSAYDAYIAQAHNTQSAKLAQRATDIARLQGNMAHIEAASALWFKLAPHSQNAALIHLSALMQQKHYSQAAAHLARCISQLTPSAFFTPLRSHISAAPVATKQAYLKLLAPFEANLAKQTDTVARGELLYTLSLTQLQLGLLPSALESAEKGLGYQPDSPLLAAQHLDVLFAQQNYSQASRELEQALQQHPNHSTLGLFKVKLAFVALKGSEDNGQRARAQQAAEAYLSHYDATPSQRFYIGRLLFDGQLYADAEAVMSALVETGALGQQPQIYLGLIALEQGQSEEAKSHFYKVTLANDIPLAAYHLSELLTSDADKPEFQAWLSDSRKRAPNAVPTLYGIEVDWLSFVGFHEEAYATLGEALEQHPNNVNLRFARALFNLDTDFAQSEIDLLAILEQEPNHPESLNTLGYYYTLQGDRLEEADVLLSRLMEIAPNVPAYMDSIGWLRYQQGRYKEAFDYIQPAYTQSPNTEVLAHLALVVWKLGDTEEAKQLLNDGLAETPDDSYLQDALTLIERRSPE